MAAPILFSRLAPAFAASIGFAFPAVLPVQGGRGPGTTGHCSGRLRRPLNSHVSQQMDPLLLFVVEDAFQLTDRGCVLVPGPSAEPGAPNVRVGDRIRLIKPDGQVVETEIKAFEMIGRRPPPKVITAPILLPKSITKDQVPIGTQVLWLGKNGSEI